MDKNKVSVCSLAVLVASVLSLFVGGGYSAKLLTWIAIAGLAASSFRFVLLIGELNFATAAFFGIGAYSAGVAFTVMELPFLVALFSGGVIACLVSLVFGFITLKTSGPYFLLIGFAFTEVMRIIYTKVEWLGGNSGLIGIFVPEQLDPYLPAFVVLISALLVSGMYLIERSSLGKVFTAIKDNESVARSVGIRVHLNKILCFAIASFAAGIAGSLHAYTNNVISPADFGFLLSTFALAYLKVGGEEYALGPVIGAVLLVLLNALALDFGGNEHIFYGAAIVICMLLFPKGLLGLAGSWLKLRRQLPATNTAVRRAEQ
ncbi:branched-chain amino acid ABC transporter permease [Pseudomonas fluorescens]|jgi:branched-chain amino acid transport system permease protein|uniref:branched-chain amino acid ABC transporter permease n=1 Tax=Pseudomonas fluorescens TaxID=294 RepID=UPI002ACA08DF|nr:branched-chain amino acid ABC transporter permease [Pseudomonas fluorescens]MDZ5431932.1 branched-chain amino acid ABC transporter permease [Pseudomonas fluorescens]